MTLPTETARRLACTGCWPQDDLSPDEPCRCTCHIPPPTCEMDGTDEDRWGGEHYWHCEEPGTRQVADLWLCAGHAEEAEEPEAECPEHGRQLVTRETATPGPDPYAVQHLACGHRVASLVPVSRT